MIKTILLFLCASFLCVWSASAQTISGTPTCINADTTPGCDPLVSVTVTPRQKLDLDENEWEADDNQGVVCAITVAQVATVNLWIHVFLQDASTVTPGTTVADATLLVPNSTATQSGPSGNLMPAGWCWAYATGLTMYASTGPLTADVTGSATNLVVVVSTQVRP